VPDAPLAAAPGPPGGVNSLALMDLYMRRAAEADRSRAPTFATADASEEALPAPDEHRVRADGERAHHLVDYIPPEQLAAMSGGGPEAAAAAARAAAAAISARERLGADNRGHQLLSRMGWTEGAGLGADGAGRVEPVAAQSNGPYSTLGVGAGSAGEDADIFEAYQKRMAMGYKYRPNPLGNPRKPY
jgi:splicing factor 4